MSALVGGVRVVLVVVEVAAAGLTIAGAGAVTVEHSQSQSAGRQSHVVSFIALIVPFARARVYMCGRVVGWLWREGDACLAASAWGERGAWAGGG